MSGQSLLAPPVPPLEIAPGFYRIGGCFRSGAIRAEAAERESNWYVPGEEVHTSFSAYLLCGEESLLYDTLPPGLSDHVLESLEELLDGTELDYVVPSHDESAHAGNTNVILDRYPDATLVGPASEYRSHEMHLFDEALLVEPGDTIDLGGHVLEFVDPKFIDTSTTLWMIERNRNVLFTADWLGLPHNESECDVLFTDQLDTPVTDDRIYQFHARAFRWFEYADPEKIADEIEYVVDAYEPEMLAPAHGLLVRDDPAAYMRQVKRVLPMIARDGTRTDFLSPE